MSNKDLLSQAVEQGTNRNRYTVIPRTLIFIFDNQKVLLLKGSADKKLWAGKYNGIGGHVEPGEDLLSSAKRELAEETGITDVDLIYCGEIQVDPGTAPGVAIHLFKGEAHQPKTQHSDEGMLEWVDLDRTSHYPLVSDLYTILPEMTNWKKGDDMLLGVTTYQSGAMVVSFVNSGRR